MSTSDRVFDSPFVKWLVAINGLVPGGLLLWDAWHHQLGVNDVNFAIRTTGLVGLVCIALSLLITPLRVVTGWNRLVAVRRNLGVLGFVYLAAHFLIFFWWDRMGSVTSTAHEILTRKYLWFGTGALLLMIPLTVTSTDAMVSKLGPVAWKRLHRLAYVIAIGAVVHYYLLVKSDVRQPIAFASVIGALLLFRVAKNEIDLRREVRAARSRKPVAPVSAKKKFWSGELTIARIFDETPDVKTFRLVACDGGALPFTHVAGQYLNLALSIDGKRVNRSYTIASAPTRTAYCEISVKRAVNGYASVHLHETWREGQRVKVSAPGGQFVFRGDEARRVLLIAGGIGITPMMSVLRSLTDRGWDGQIDLLFSVRAVRDVAFRDELDYLQSRFQNLRVRILVAADPDTPWTGLRGQITRDVIADFVPDLTGCRILLCGPPPMMTAMRQILVGMGVPDGDIHQEAFVSRPPVEENVPVDVSATDDTPVDGIVPSVAFTRSGHTAELAADQTVLEVAEDSGVAIPYECRSGVCGQCKTRLVSGRVRMDVQDALTAADRAKGLILACQARAFRDIEVEA